MTYERTIMAFSAGWVTHRVAMAIIAQQQYNRELRIAVARIRADVALSQTWTDLDFDPPKRKRWWHR